VGSAASLLTEEGALLLIGVAEKSKSLGGCKRIGTMPERARMSRSSASRKK